MSQNMPSTVGVVVSILFGLVVALLAVTGSSALSTVSMVGGIVVGITWVVVGAITVGRRRPDA